MDEVKALEYETLKVPYEVLNKRFRASQRIIDREVSHVINACNGLQNGGNAEELPVLIANVEQSMKSLSERAKECVANQKVLTGAIRDRTKHLKSCASLSDLPSSSDSEASNDASSWRQTRINRLVAEYFLMNGYYESARLLIEATDIGKLTNVEVFATARTVESALRNKNSSPCLAWCAENKSKLKKIRSTLEFNLHKQGFVELVRMDMKIEALAYAKDYILNAMTDHNQYKELEELSGILAYLPENFMSSPYRKFFEEERWNDLAEQFKADNYKVHCINSTPLFAQLFNTGLCAIRTSSCYKNGEANANCPTCDPFLKEIARGLPTGTLSQSRVICRITGEIMNEHNPPLMLPNGHAYSTEALLEMSQKNGGRIICPVTGQQFLFTDCLKVFLM
ncbi:E3 ubiquitin-protein transferase MAEA-like [Convolutriloba macropyga]|uniref:E3 ubiquitin-protein transferase MAEA-like n=1 Tax=Convolutriloba macropyga TaxID=536237 RepID=UPI003F525575